MPRPPRHHFPGATHHVMLRGNNGQDIFKSDADRCRLCLMLQSAVERYGFQLIAFCFMSNHIHLALAVDRVPLSEIFQTVTGRYSRYFNRKYETKGHLFQGRFHSLMVDGEIYLRHLIRYIHLNPLKGGLASAPEEYRWSSHPSYLDQAMFTWLAKEQGLKLFGDAKEDQIAHFEQFVRGGIGQEELIDFLRTYRQGILGKEAFKDQVAKRAKMANYKKKITVEALLEVVGPYYDFDPRALQSSGRDRRSAHARAMTAYLAREIEGITLADIATFFGQGASGVSKAVGRIARKLPNSPDVRDELHALRTALDS